MAKPRVQICFVFTPEFHDLITEAAKSFGISRHHLVINACRHYIEAKAVEAEEALKQETEREKR